MLTWDTALLAAAAIAAVSTLVQLMGRRRDELVADVHRQIEEHRAATPARPDAEQKSDAA